MIRWWNSHLNNLKQRGERRRGREREPCHHVMSEGKSAGNKIKFQSHQPELKERWHDMIQEKREWNAPQGMYTTEWMMQYSKFNESSKIYYSSRHSDEDRMMMLWHIIITMYDIIVIKMRSQCTEQIDLYGIRVICLIWRMRDFNKSLISVSSDDFFLLSFFDDGVVVMLTWSSDVFR